MSAFRRLGQVDGGQDHDCANLHTEGCRLTTNSFWQQTLDLPQGTSRSIKAALPCRTSTRTPGPEEADTEHLRLASRADMVRLLPVSREGTDSSHLVVDTEHHLLASRVDTEHRLLVSRVDMERLLRASRVDTAVVAHSSRRTERLRARDTADLRRTTRTRGLLRVRIRSCGSGSLRWIATVAARSTRRS